MSEDEERLEEAWETYDSDSRATENTDMLEDEEGDRAFTAEYEEGIAPGQCPRCGRLACQCGRTTG